MTLIQHSKPWLTEKDEIIIKKNFNSANLARGPITEEFEDRVCRYLGAKRAVAVSSGTSALFLALKLLDIKKGDEVILPTYVCESVLEVVNLVEAKPVLCDVNLNGVIELENILPHITGQTKAIIAVHIFGHPCNVKSLQSTGIPVIGDLCQAFGLTPNHDVMGDIGVLSFGATKCLTTGEGGMIILKDDVISGVKNRLEDSEIVKTIQLLAPLSDFQSSLGISQLNRYAKFLSKRSSIRNIYDQKLDNLNIPIHQIDTNILFRYTVRSKHDFLYLQEKFLSEGICVRRGVDQLLHQKIGMSDSGFVNAINLFQSTISIPFYPALSEQEINKISRAFSFFK